jgi:hypothetical protein
MPAFADANQLESVGARQNGACALSVSADSLIFEQDERGPSEELRQFEAVSQLLPAEQAVVTEVLAGAGALPPEGADSSSRQRAIDVIDDLIELVFVVAPIHSDDAAVSADDHHVRYAADAIRFGTFLPGIVCHQQLESVHSSCEAAEQVGSVRVDGDHLNALFACSPLDSFEDRQLFQAGRAP